MKWPRKVLYDEYIMRYNAPIHMWIIHYLWNILHSIRKSLHSFFFFSFFLNICRLCCKLLFMVSLLNPYPSIIFHVRNASVAYSCTLLAKFNFFFHFAFRNFIYKTTIYFVEHMEIFATKKQSYESSKVHGIYKIVYDLEIEASNF